MIEITRIFLWIFGAVLIPIGYLIATRFRGQRRIWMLGTLMLHFSLLAVAGVFTFELMDVPFALFPLLSDLLYGYSQYVILNMVFAGIYAQLLFFDPSMVLPARETAEGIQTVAPSARIWRFCSATFSLIWRAVGWLLLVQGVWWWWDLWSARSHLDNVFRYTPFPSPLPGSIPLRSVFFAYIASLTVGLVGTFVVLIPSLRRYRGIRGMIALLATGLGGCALVLADLLGNDFWHSYGHAVHNQCGGMEDVWSGLVLILLPLPAVICPFLSYCGAALLGRKWAP